MTAKETTIKNAYISAGVDWEQVKEYVDENGVLPPSRHKQFIPSGKGKEWGFNQSGMYPKSLRGIETNNGWISIESEKDLPSESASYFVHTKDGNIIVHHFSSSSDFDKMMFTKTFTHYQPIIKPSLPLY